MMKIQMLDSQTFKRAIGVKIYVLYMFLLHIYIYNYIYTYVCMCKYFIYVHKLQVSKEYIGHGPMIVTKQIHVQYALCHISFC